MRFIRQLIPTLALFISIILIITGVICSWCFYFGISFLVIIFCIEYIYYLINRKGQVDIKTPDGSNEPYHPSVLFFKDKWNGFSYWMAYTPFPISGKPYQDRWEFPCIAVSNDGILWEDANNGRPLDELTKEQISCRDYFSDTHLVFNKEKDVIELYYRLSEKKNSINGQKGVWLFRRYSKDGLTWSDREVVFAPDDTSVYINHHPAISPAIVYIDKMYKMWYVIENKSMMTIHFAVSEDGINWKYASQCNFFGLSVNPWHIDCLYKDGKYYMITYDFSQRLLLWESKDGVAFKIRKEILTPSKKCGSFYKQTLYRSCLVKDHEYKVYFSAGNDRKVGIGLMAGATLENLKVISASSNYQRSQFFLDLLDKYTFVFRWFIWKTTSRKIGVL